MFVTFRSIGCRLQYVFGCCIEVERTQSDTDNAVMLQTSADTVAN